MGFISLDADGDLFSHKKKEKARRLKGKKTCKERREKSRGWCLSPGRCSLHSSILVGQGHPLHPSCFLHQTQGSLSQHPQ